MSVSKREIFLGMSTESHIQDKGGIILLHLAMVIPEMERGVSFYVSYFNKVIYKLEKILMRTRMMKFRIMN